jgi:hypothetical protein
MKNEYRILVGNPEDHSEDLGVYRSIILKWISGKQDGIHLARDRDRWRTLVNTVVNLRVHERRQICWLADRALGISNNSHLCGISCSSIYHSITRGCLGTCSLSNAIIRFSLHLAACCLAAGWGLGGESGGEGEGWLSSVLFTVFQFTSRCFPMKKHPEVGLGVSDIEPVTMKCRTVSMQTGPYFLRTLGVSKWLPRCVFMT